MAKIFNVEVLRVRQMKDSGVEWIGEIPQDWNFTALKRVAFIQTGNTPSKNRQEIYYSNANGIPWIKADNMGTYRPIVVTAEYLTSAGANEGRIFPPNTVYVCCIASVGKVGYSNITASCNQQINALLFNELYFWKYGYYVTIAQEDEYQVKANGNVVKILNTETQSNLIVPIPTITEQNRIATFLDKKCTEIDNAISKTTASIEEYKKLKQAIITKAVTKGIRGNRPMKDSGIEWIGEIPAVWEVNKAFQLFREVKNKNIGLQENNLLSLSYGNIKRKDINTTEGLLPESFEGYNIIDVDNIVLRLTDLQNDHKSLRVGLCKERGIITSAYVTLDNFSNNLAGFLYYQLHAFDVAKGFYSMGGGVRQSLNWDGLKNHLLAIPPIDEQREILRYLHEKTRIIDELVSKKELFIIELEKYKKSLIYEYVTGKKEVV